MPPRYAYWTIIADGLPTAFRATRKDELLPTFARIKTTHPDAEMKWFARGRLWESPESARREREAPPRRGRDESRTARTGGERAGRTQRARRPAHPERGRDWRPGGEHRDPRQKFKDAKKARNTSNRRRKFERRERVDRSSPSTRFSPSPGSEEPKPPPRPPGPHREPKPQEGTEPTPPPRPTEPVTTPPGPPERGRRDPARRRGGRLR